MGLSTVEWTLWWAQAAFSALPWITARTSRRRRLDRTRGWTKWIPADWFVFWCFVVSWVLSLVALWLWGRTRDGRNGDNFDAVNWLYFANVLLQAIWIVVLNEWRHQYGWAATAAFGVAGTALGILVVQGISAGPGDVWASLGVYLVPALWHWIVFAWTLGFATGHVHHKDEGDGDGAAAAVDVESTGASLLGAQRPRFTVDDDDDGDEAIDAGGRLSRMRRGRL
jgi:hypothetical protein